MGIIVEEEDMNKYIKGFVPDIANLIQRIEKYMTKITFGAEILDFSKPHKSAPPKEICSMSMYFLLSHLK